MTGIAEFAPVGNLHVYRALDYLGVLGHYHLLLAHQVEADFTQYHDFYAGRKKRGHLDRVILDNSLIELGSPLEIGKMRVAIDTLQDVDVLQALVLPDVQRDLEQTIQVSTDAWHELRTWGLLGTPLLGVIQGVTEEECITCANHYLGLDLQYLSVPRWMTEHYGTREIILTEVLKLGKPVHLLGFSNNLYDDFKCAHMRGVIGIDSAVPIWLGLQSRLIGWNPRLYDYGKRPPWYNDWDVSSSSTYLPHMTAEVVSNLMRVNSWLDPIRSTLARPNCAA